MIKLGTMTVKPAGIARVYVGNILVYIKSILKTVSGIMSIILPDAVSHALISLTQKGVVEQDGTPTPDAPVDIVCNNGTLKYSANLLNVSAETIKHGYYINNEGKEVTNSYNFYITQQIPVKPSTTYTFSVSELIAYCSIMEYNAAGEFIKRTLFGASSTRRIDTDSFTTTANTAFILFGSNPFYAIFTDEEVLAINWMLNEGNAAMAYEPYRGGIYTDDTPEALTLGSHNLFNPDYYSGHGWYVNNNQIMESTAPNATLVMPCKPNTTYSWWHCEGKGGCRAFEMDTDTFDVGDAAKWAVSSPVSTDTNIITSYTTSENAKYLCICFSRRDTSSTRSHNEQLEDFMLVEGQVSEAYAYEPYRTPQTATVPNLYAVGGYKDEVDVISGQIIRRVGVKVLDGTENWAESGTLRYILTILDMAVLSGRTEGMCTHFDYAGSTAKKGTYFLTSARRFFLHTDFSSSDDLKEWLASQYAAGTPVIVLYPLAQETTESIAPQSLSTGDGTNAIIATANVENIELSAEYMATPD